MRTAETPPLDLAVLRAQSGGDAELERELLALFREQCDRLMPVIAARGDGAARSDAAHTLRGGAAAVGAERVVALSRSFEEAARPAEKAGLAQELEAAVEEVRRAIAERLGDAG